jgi:hypothetical protein
VKISVDFTKEQLAKANNVTFGQFICNGEIVLGWGKGSWLGQGKDCKIRSALTKDSGRLCVPSLSQGLWFLGAGSGMHPSLCTLFWRTT